MTEPPAPRRSTQLALHLVRVLLFAGKEEKTFLADLWSWDGVRCRR